MTELPKDQLPALPHGWDWDRAAEGWLARSVDDARVEVDCYLGEFSIERRMYSERGCAPIEVVVAVLRANGYVQHEAALMAANEEMGK